MRPYRIITDVEATCWSSGSNQSEIIEIGMVLVDILYRTIDEFQTFVKPIIHTNLSRFCTELTTITQDQVDSAPDFPQALAKINTWLQKHNTQAGQLLLSSWGYYDKRQFEKDCKLHSVKYPFGEHNSIKHDYAELRNCKPCGITKALRKEGLEFNGIHHRGIDDTRNIAKLAKLLYQNP